METEIFVDLFLGICCSSFFGWALDGIKHSAAHRFLTKTPLMRRQSCRLKASFSNENSANFLGTKVPSLKHRFLTKTPLMRRQSCRLKPSISKTINKNTSNGRGMGGRRGSRDGGRRNVYV